MTQILDKFNFYWDNNLKEKELYKTFRPIMFATLKESVRGTDDRSYIIEAGKRVRVLDKHEDGTYGIHDDKLASAFSNKQPHWAARVTIDKLENFSYTYKK